MNPKKFLDWYFTLEVGYISMLKYITNILLAFSTIHAYSPHKKVEEDFVWMCFFLSSKLPTVTNSKANRFKILKAKKKKVKKEVETKKKKSIGSVKEETVSPKKKKKDEEEQEVWKW